MSKDLPRGKFDGVPTPALCAELATLEAPQRSKPPKTKGSTSVEWDRCPGHAAPGNTGLVNEGGHLVWRHHLIRLMSGATYPCGTSGARLCDAPSRTGHAECPCEDGVERTGS